jgi:hypothetical protein
VTVDVMLACNSPRNGMPEGRVDRVDIPGVIELSGDDLPCSVGRSGLEVAGQRFTVLGFADWVGNWCWSQVKLSPDDTLRLLELLRERHWTCELAPMGFFERWEDGRALALPMGVMA